MSDCLAGGAHCVQDVSEIVVQLRRVRIESKSSAIGRHRFIQLPLGFLCIAETIMERGVSRVLKDRPGEKIRCKQILRLLMC